MLPVKKILCPTDFSEPSREALKTGGEFASHFRAELALLHVVPVLPALPSDPNYVLRVPEYERLLHNDADEKLFELARELTTGNTLSAPWWAMVMRRARLCALPNMNTRISS
jgi:nucleotide-binding universal stress UspA family protein